MKILFLIKQSFPFGSAYSTRARSFVNILLELGYSVTVLCSGGGDTPEEHSYFNANPNVERIIVRERKGVLQSIDEAIEYGNSVSRLLSSDNYEFIITSSMHEKISKILSAGRINRVPVILESCEWYHYTSWRFGKVDPRYWSFLYAWIRFFPKADGFITISTLLQKHYENNGKPTIRIPTITDVQSIKPNLVPPNTDGRINLLFAGRFGGTKDDVIPFVYAIASDDSLLDSYRLSIVGPSRDDLFAHKSSSKALSILEKNGSLRITGRIPQYLVEDEYRKADYGCFLRPIRRSSNAGFSTKLGEGMSVGTPFIVNDTSDISMYVENGFSGFILNDSSITSVVKTLKLIASSNNESRALMRLAARKVAEQSFDWHSYIGSMDRLLKNVKETYRD